MTDILNDVLWIKRQWMECEAELLRVKSERDRYKAALQEIAKVPEFLPEDFEHKIAAQALEGK